MSYYCHFRPHYGAAIWMTNVYTKSTDQCISTRNACPTSQVTSCSHTEDITIECSQLQVLCIYHKICISF